MTASVSAQAAADTSSLEADAFRKLYPETYYQKFLEDGIRPDGRTLGRSRATTIGLGTITTADGSSLVKQGNTTVLAGIRLSICRPSESTPDCGSLSLNVELAPFSSADWRPGKAPELVSSVSEHLQRVLLGSSPAMPGCFPLRQLCLAEGKAAWSLTMDIYILNADGAVLDAVLLAAVSALVGTQLPPTITSPEGEVRRQRRQHDGGAPPADGVAQEGKPVTLQQLPLALTCSLYKGHVLVDPTAEEEGLAGSLVTVVLDQSSQLHGLLKAGGTRPASQMEVLRCVESAKLRYKEVMELLNQAMDELRGAAADVMET